MGCTTPVVDVPPNIILIYVDDLGWRDLGVQGSRYYETPNVDFLAVQGMRFTDAYANAPNCAPSRAALLSGQYPPRTGIYTVGAADRGPTEFRALVPVANQTELSLDVVTLAETLAEAGYATGHAGKWHLGGEGFLPTDQGFKWSVAGDEQGSPPDYFYPYKRGQRFLRDLEEGREDEYLADRLVDESILFIKREAKKPFFLYLSHYSVHTPIQGKPELAARYADKAGLPIRFDDLNSDARAQWGLDADAAAKRLYVLHEGQLTSGIPGFLVLWAQMPRYRLLGRIVGLPGVRQIASATYDHVLAPVIYRWHLRRLRKQSTPSTK